MAIVRLLRNQIIDEKWDACISLAFNGHVFALSWYLDIVCHTWEAIVIDDYQVVMPLPVYRGNVVQYVYTPHWCPYLGIINQKPLDEDTVWEILSQVSYFNAHAVFNSYNKLPLAKASKYQQAKYSVLDLIMPIDRYELVFKSEVEPAIAAFKSQQITVVRDLNGGEYIDFARRVKYSSKKELGQLLQIISFSLRYKSAGLYAAYDERNELIAAAFLLKTNKSISLVHCAAVDANLRGVIAIIYNMIKNNAGANLTLEFPFYSSELGQYFSTDQHHCLVYKKGLPKWISLISS